MVNSFVIFGLLLVRCNFHTLVDANVHSESDTNEVDESCKGEENLVELDPYSLET